MKNYRVLANPILVWASLWEINIITTYSLANLNHD